ncbi:hypothetical protein AAEX63_08555 [Luteococcus sp. H138]|uniref:hypothetical protein n=1 Tax=unclassified Luteococcus TaxID=2639923 RepID=UPI00313C7C2A
MGFLRKKKSSEAPHMDAALPMLTVDQATRLRGLAAADLQARGMSIDVADDHLVSQPDGAFFGLWNLAAKVSGQPDVVWPSIVTEHLRTTMAGLDQSESQSLDLDRLIVRLMPEDADALGPIMTYAREWMPGVWCALAVDLPESVQTVTDKLLDEVEDVDEAYQRGLQRLREDFASADFQVSELPQDQPPTFTAAVSDWVYAGSTPLIMDAVLARFAPQADPTSSVLFCVPNRHQFAFHVIDAPEPAMHALMHLPHYAMVGFNEVPGPLTPFVYVWHDGQVTQITRVDGETLVAEIPVWLGELLGQETSPE